MNPEIYFIGDFLIQSYGLFVVIGGYAAFFYMSFYAKKELNIKKDKIAYLAFLIILFSFIGAKVFFYLEDPEFYFGTPSNMISSLGSGFVFFGCAIFGIPAMYWFFWKNKWPIWQMLDLMAFMGIIAQTFGRMGCFMAGCCYGIPTESWVGVVFTHPNSLAKPLHTALHPTQLYEVVLLASIGLFLFWYKDRKKFQGQLILIYLIIYSIGRIFIEVYRGDLARGYIIDEVLTHSQLISIFIITTFSIIYVHRKTNKSIYPYPKHNI